MADLAMPAAQCSTPAQQLNDRFTAIYATYLPRITALVRSRIFDDAYKYLTDDLTAEAFTQVWLSLHRCNATTDEQLFSWLATIARRAVAQHFRVKKHTMTRPVDTADWAFANRDLVPAGAFLAPTRHAGDSDPDMDEALRRARQPRQLAGAR